MKKRTRAVEWRKHEWMRGTRGQTDGRTNASRKWHPARASRVGLQSWERDAGRLNTGWKGTVRASRSQQRLNFPTVLWFFLVCLEISFRLALLFLFSTFEVAFLSVAIHFSSFFYDFSLSFFFSIIALKRGTRPNLCEWVSKRRRDGCCDQGLNLRSWEERKEFSTFDSFNFSLFYMFIL